MTSVESSSVTISARSLMAVDGNGGDHTVVWMRGEHDAANVDTLVETLGRAIAMDDADLVVDMSGVEFMGARTVNALVRADDVLRTRSRTLTVRAPSRTALRVIELCGVGCLLGPRQDDHQQAMAPTDHEPESLNGRTQAYER